MATRTGAPTIKKIAIRLCQLLTKFTPILTALHPGNTALLAALAAANGACSVLVEEIEGVIEYGD